MWENSSRDNRHSPVPIGLYQCWTVAHLSYHNSSRKLTQKDKIFSRAYKLTIYFFHNWYWIISIISSSYIELRSITICFFHNWYWITSIIFSSHIEPRCCKTHNYKKFDLIFVRIIISLFLIILTQKLTSNHKNALKKGAYLFKLSKCIHIKN